MKMLLDSYDVRHDQAAYVGFVRRSTEMLEEVMRADLANSPEPRQPDGADAGGGSAEPAPERTGDPADELDNQTPPASDRP